MVEMSLEETCVVYSRWRSPLTFQNCPPRYLLIFRRRRRRKGKAIINSCHLQQTWYYDQYCVLWLVFKSRQYSSCTDNSSQYMYPLLDSVSSPSSSSSLSSVLDVHCYWEKNGQEEWEQKRELLPGALLVAIVFHQKISWQLCFVNQRRYWW